MELIKIENELFVKIFLGGKGYNYVWCTPSKSCNIYQTHWASSQRKLKIIFMQKT